MPIVGTEPLTCPHCGKEGTRANTGVNRFKHNLTGDMWGKCWGCNESWPLERKTEKYRPPFPFPLREWAHKRGILTEGIDAAPVKTAAWVKADGTESKGMTGLVFDYGGGAEHWISINKLPGKDGKERYKQRWKPDGFISTVARLWEWRNPALDNPDPETAYLCEGEKDALTMGQAGFLAFGTPGANSLRTDRANWLADRLKAENITRLRICFDCDPAGKSGSALSLSRLATKYKLDLEILKWPEGTPDGSDVGDLARTFGAGFARTLLGMEWVNPWADVSAAIVEQVEPEGGSVWNDPDAVHIYGSLYRWKNASYVRREGQSHKELSNYVMDVLVREKLEDGAVEYTVILKGEPGTTDPISIPSDAFADKKSFRKRCMYFGLYNNLMTDADLWRISIYEASRPHVIPVIRLTGYGWQKDHGFYAFPTGIVADGTFHPADPDTGLIRLPDQCYSVHGEDITFLSGVRPRFYADDFAVSDINTAGKEVSQYVTDLIGKPDTFEGLLILGWFLSTYLSDLPFERVIGPEFQAAFPFLMNVGAKESGKTEGICRLYPLLGMSGMSGGATFGDSTDNFFSKAMKVLRNIPMWFEEIISGNKSKISIGTLKTAYNRTAPGKGAKVGGYNLDCRASLCMCGEEPIPEIVQRSILIQYPHATERQDHNREAFRWLGANGAKLRRIGAAVMVNRTKSPAVVEGKWIKAVLHIDAWLKTLSISDRIRQNYASALAGLALLPDYGPDVKDFFKNPMGSRLGKWINRHMEQNASVLAEANPIINGLDLYFSEPENLAFRVGDVIYLPSARIESYLNRIRDFNHYQFKQALRTAPYCLKLDRGRIPDTNNAGWQTRREDMQIRCYHLKVSHKALPESIRFCAYGWTGTVWIRDRPEMDDDGEAE